MEINVGNFAIGVRGTLFIAGHGEADFGHVIMLEGNVIVDESETVAAGYVMALREDAPPVVTPIRLKDLDGFAIQAIIDYRERVLAAGFISEEELENFLNPPLDIPDYIWIRDSQISTEITSLSIRMFHSVIDDNIPNSYSVIMWGLTSEEIEPLRYMINLTRLILTGQQITYITPLAGLRNLSMLHLIDNQVSDITPLAGLVNLRNIELSNNQVSDITPLEGLVELRSLWLNSNQIRDISPLAELTRLESLALSHNPITDWSPVNHVETVLGRP